MLKRIAATFTILLALSSPVNAYQVDREHQLLINKLEEKGVAFYVNPEEICSAESLKERELPPNLSGLYVFNPYHRKSVMVVCQDNRTGEQEVAWTANDLDTIRHESVHFLQDCISGLDGKLDPFYDGAGPAPGTDTYADVIKLLGVEKARRIAFWYQKQMAANGQIVRLEHEAFAVAENRSAEYIANNIDSFCR